MFVLVDPDLGPQTAGETPSTRRVHLLTTRGRHTNGTVHVLFPDVVCLLPDGRLIHEFLSGPFLVVSDTLTDSSDSRVPVLGGL